jgi:hypothetical protein
LLLVFHHLKLVIGCLYPIHRQQMGIKSLYRMSMNSYLGQIPPLPSLLGRSVPLDTVALSKPLPRQSDHYVDRLAFTVEQSRAAPGLSCGAQIVVNTIGQSEFTIEQSGIASDRPAASARQSGYGYANSTLAHYAPIFTHHDSSTFHPLHI